MAEHKSILPPFAPILFSSLYFSTNLFLPSAVFVRAYAHNTKKALIANEKKNIIIVFEILVSETTIKSSRCSKRNSICRKSWGASSIFFEF